MKKIVLVGIQGSGKSTQGNLLSEKLGIPYLSTGHIMREIAKEKTQMGRYIKEIINAGGLVSDDIMIKIVEEYLARPEYSKGYILDGYPRTVEQARVFNGTIDDIFYLKIPDEEAIKRLSLRDDDSREDDTVTGIKKRLDLFHEHTEPVLAHYREHGKLHEIDGMHSIDQIHQEICSVLGN